MTHADDMIARAFPEAESVRWGSDIDGVWLKVCWLKSPLVEHVVRHSDGGADSLIGEMKEYRATRLVARLLEIVRK